MTTPAPGVVYLVVCGAGPATYTGRFVTEARERGWDVCVIATPAALDFIDAEALETRSGHPVKSHYRSPDEPRARASLPRADAVVVAPATYNTVNKWAQGISDTYALGVLAETIGLDLPVVVVPFVNTSLAAHFAFTRSVRELRAAGVRILHGPGDWEPHAPGTGGTQVDAFPWARALDEAERLTSL